VIALGAVIRGATPTSDFVAGESGQGIGNLAVTVGRPISYRLLTTDTIEQALERAGAKAGNKGFDPRSPRSSSRTCIAHSPRRRRRRGK